MSIFRKPKEDDKDLADEKEGGKSLKSVKVKRKPKESWQPWGKKERYLVLVIFLLTVLTSGFLALSSRSWKLPGWPKISLPSFKSETIIIEKNKKMTTQDQKAQAVKKSFIETTRGLSGVYGLYVIRLDDGSDYGVFETEVFEPASLNKLPVLATLFLEVEKGNLDLETKYVLKESDKISGSGTLSSKPAGTVLTYRELARALAKQSDNTAFGILKNILGKKKIEAVIEKIGMNQTVIFGQKQKTTPKDIGLFFQKLWQGQIVSQKSRDEILNYLTDTAYEAWLTEGIPGFVRVAHKFGRELHVVNDAGIVFSERPFVLVIMSKGVVKREADTVFPNLARIVYEAETE